MALTIYVPLERFGLPQAPGLGLWALGTVLAVARFVARVAEGVARSGPFLNGKIKEVVSRAAG